MPNQSEIYLMLAGGLLVLGLGAWSRCVVRRRARSRRKWLALLGIVLMLGSYVSFMTPKVQRYGVYRYLPTWSLICLAPARVPESPFYIVPPPKKPADGNTDAVSYKAQLWLSYRSVCEELSPFERWLWITIDRNSGAPEGKRRIIMDLEGLWSPHSLDLEREQFETEYIEIFPYLLVGGGYRRNSGSIFSSPTECVDSKPIYAVTQLRDLRSGITAQEFVEELGYQLRSGKSDSTWWAYEKDDRDDQRQRALAKKMAVQEYPFPIEVSQFGMHVVFEFDEKHTDAVRLLLERLCNPLAITDAGLPLTGADKEWYRDQPSPPEVRELVPGHAQRSWSPWSYWYPRVERVYDTREIYALLLDKECMDKFIECWSQYTFESLSPSIYVKDLEGAETYGIDVASLASMRPLGTSLRLTAPLEVHAVILDALKQWAERYSGNGSEAFYELEYIDGQLRPRDPNK